MREAGNCGQNLAVYSTKSSNTYAQIVDDFRGEARKNAAKAQEAAHQFRATVNKWAELGRIPQSTAGQMSGQVEPAEVDIVSDHSVSDTPTKYSHDDYADRRAGLAEAMAGRRSAVTRQSQYQVRTILQRH